MKDRRFIEPAAERIDFDVREARTETAMEAGAWMSKSQDALPFVERA